MTKVTMDEGACEMPMVCYEANRFGICSLSVKLSLVEVITIFYRLNVFTTGEYVHECIYSRLLSKQQPRCENIVF